MKDLLAMDGLSIAVIVIVAVLMAVLLAELIALVVISNKKDKKGGDEVATDEPAPEEPITEESASEEESVGEEPAEEPAVAPQPDIAIAAATVPPFGDANRMSRSFMAKLIQCGGLMQERYGAVKNELLSYNKVKSRLGWSGEAFRRGRATVAKLAIRGKTLVICLAIDPATLEGTKYRYKDVGEVKKFAAVPCMVKLKSPRSVKYAIELIGQIMDREGAIKGEQQNVSYAMAYEDDEKLIRRELIKVKG